jgi:DNA-binding transcriptional MerR regulator
MSARLKDHFLIREFAGLTGTTVRTLHYYDRVGLLRPSGRRPNGYRVYTPADFLRIEQIIALKFLGFSLGEIAGILARPSLTAAKSFRVQAGLIAEEIRRLEGAERALRRVLGQLDADRKVDLNKVITIIKEIQMSAEKKKDWAERFYSPEEMKEFQAIGQGYTPEQMKVYQKKWADLIAEVGKNLGVDPAGPVGQELARRWEALFNEAYGGHPKLKERMGEAYRSGAVPAEHRMIRPEVWTFITQAASASRKKTK